MKYKVLLIDDEPGALEGMQLWIDWQGLGFEVCGTCTNGVEGLRMIQELRPDLVVTDVNMPLMDGLAMIAAWEKVESRVVTFAILSGYSDFKYAQKAMRYGVNHYLLKPVIPEEAEEELKEIYLELMEETEKQSLTRIASHEEVISLIKELLNEQTKEERGLQILSSISASREEWNFCLIKTEARFFAELRTKAASMLQQEEAMYLIDLESVSFAIVYGYSDKVSIEDRTPGIIHELTHQYSSYQVFIAVGAGESSLLQIERCYRTAKEAVSYKFYDPDYPGVISYEQVWDKSFNYHYDQMRLVEGMIAAVTLLDKPGFREAVDSAACSFREMLIAPEVVKKIVIHVLYRIMEYMREACGAQVESLIEKYTIPGISDSVLTLKDVMNGLLSCGEESIDMLMNEKSKQSQGIVQDINDYIRGHFSEHLTIKKLSEVFYMHPVYLGQLLMKKNGISFHELLHNLRIEESVSLLGKNKLKNSEIAEQVGYSHYGQFLKQFESRMHMPPNEYKKTMF